MQHGLQKLFGVLGGFGGTPGATAPLVSLMGLAGVLEFGGGLFVAVGFFTRPVAALLLVEMLIAFFMSHFPRGGWPIENRGELALFYAATWAFFGAHGAGIWSVDMVLNKRR